MTKLKEEKEETVTYSLGNETIIQPVSASLKDNAAVLTIVNIIIGIVLGAAVVWFLISPTVIQNKTRETNNTIVELSEEVAARDTQISVLKDELESYRSTDEEAKSAIESSGNTQESYETVLRVKELYDAGATSNADMTELLLQVQPDALGERGKAVYDEVAGELFPKMCERYYQSAQEKIAAEDYAGAVTDLEKVVQMDLEYDGGSAKLLLEDTKQKVQ